MLSWRASVTGQPFPRWVNTVNPASMAPRSSIQAGIAMTGGHHDALPGKKLRGAVTGITFRCQCHPVWSVPAMLRSFGWHHPHLPPLQILVDGRRSKPGAGFRNGPSIWMPAIICRARGSASRRSARWRSFAQSWLTESVMTVAKNWFTPSSCIETHARWKSSEVSSLEQKSAPS